MDVSLKRPVYEDQDMNATPGRLRAQSGVLLYHLSPPAGACVCV
jgi:hypothetical protein